MKRRPVSRLDVWGNAKVNIGWHVGAKRPDGYHDVCGLVQTISLCDRLEIETSDEGEAGVRLSVPGFEALEDPSNLIVSAARVLERHAETRPTTIVVRKAIPVAAGLGGGSADAAAALVGLNAVWGAGLSPHGLMDLAGEISSDVPAILLGGLVHASGRGERVRNTGAFSDGWFVLGLDVEQVSAAAAYDAFDRLPPQRAEGLHGNDLERAACSLVPHLAERVEAMRSAAGVAFVSGSGPTVVGICADEEHARKVAKRVRESFADVRLAQPSSWGVRLVVGAEPGP